MNHPLPRSRMLRIVRTAALVAVLLPALALQGLAQSGPPANMPSRTAADVDRAVRYEHGRAVYLELHCGACHALGAAASLGIFGPAHDAMGIIAQARLADVGYIGSAESAAAYIRESITDPAAYIVPGYAFTRHPMPAYELAGADLDALVFFLLAQDGSGGLPQTDVP